MNPTGASRRDTRPSTLRRIISFAPLPALSLLAPLMALPVMARNLGAEGWAAFGVGQSMGGLLAVAVAGGWPLAGPVTIAGRDRGYAYAIYVRSVQHRLILLACLIAPVAGGVAILVGDSSRLLAVVTAVGVGASGLSPAWFAAGLGQASVVAVFDVAPRLIFTILAMVTVVALGPTWVIAYPVGLLVASIGGSLGFLWFAKRRAVPLTSVPSITQTIRLTKAAFGAAVLGAVYTASSVALVSLVSSVAQTARFASGFRLYSIALQLVVVISQVTQLWARAGEGATRSQRATAKRLYTYGGVAGAIGFAITGPYVSTVLFGGEFAVPFRDSALLSVAFLSVSLGTFLATQVILPLRGSAVVLRTTLLAAIVGSTVTIVAAQQLGSTGGALGVACAEATVLVVYIGVTLRIRKGGFPA